MRAGPGMEAGKQTPAPRNLFLMAFSAAGPRTVPVRSGHETAGAAKAYPNPLGAGNVLRTGTVRGPPADSFAPGLGTWSAFFAPPASPFDQRTPFFASRAWFFDYRATFVTLERRPLALAARPLTIARGPSTMGHGPLAIGPAPLPLGPPVLTIGDRHLPIACGPLPLGRRPFPLGRRPLTLGRRSFPKERRSLTTFYEKRVSEPPQKAPKHQQNGPFPPKTPVSALPRPPNRKPAENHSRPAPAADPPT